MQISNTHYRLHLDNIQDIEYTRDELELWKRGFDRLMLIQERWAERQISKKFMEVMVPELGLKESEVPQLRKQSEMHRKRSGWRLRPVTGFLTLQ